MKFKTILFSVVLSGFFLFGCAPRNQNDSDLIHIDVSRSYPVKEIRLEEVADIEFLQLETHEDFLFRGLPRVITSDKIIFGQSNGDILVFSRDGKPISGFNRRGGGPGYYINIQGLVYDEAANEIFIESPGNRIMVYSLAGDFRRMLPLLEGSFLGGLVSFDSESLLLYDINNIYPAPFSLISKKDGSVIATVDLPNDNRIPHVIEVNDRQLGTVFIRPSFRGIIRHNDGFLLNNYATDTLFFFSQNMELSPFLVRTPGLHSTNPIVVLSGFVEAGNYQFIQTERFQIENPIAFLMRNRRTGSIYRQRITFDDFRVREVTISHATISSTQNSRLGLISLDLTELQDANDEGRLSGRLQEIVESSYEFGSNVFMLLHFK
jgi:hypothetical protein